MHRRVFSASNLITEHRPVAAKSPYPLQGPEVEEGVEVRGFSWSPLQLLEAMVNWGPAMGADRTAMTVKVEMAEATGIGSA
jgi:hypothetical protein